jgi:hypothetical protein
MTRPAISIAGPTARADSSEPTTNRASTTMKAALRPTRSVNRPKANAPTTMPANTMEPIQPTVPPDSWNSDLMNSSAPEMITRS